MKNLRLSVIALMAIFTFSSCSSDDDGIQDQPQETADLYATSNSNGNISKYDVKDRQNPSRKSFLTLSTNSQGIFYDAERDEVTKASRSLLQLNTFANISVTEDGVSLTANISASADLESPTDLAVNGNTYVVADNSILTGGRFLVYTRSSTGFTLRNTVSVDFAVWGITFVGNDLYATVRNTGDIAVFTNFVATNTTNATAQASKRITIEGMSNARGIAYNGGTMVITDIGTETGGSANTDGAFHIITNFQSKFNGVANGGTMAMAGNHTRVAGSGTFLGNPVAAEYDAVTNTVFIAENSNGGGRVLAFANADASGGNLTPVMNSELSGASSLYLHKK